MKEAWLLLSWLAVLPAAAAPELEVELTPRRPWLGQEVRYRVVLYRDSHLQQGDFLPPEVAGALLLSVGESEPEPVVRGGRDMERVTAEWRLFPLESGTLLLPAPVYTGRDLFVQGTPQRLEVRPPPTTERPAGRWLVARTLEAEQVWMGDPQALTVGEGVVRRLRVRAQGVPGALIPEPEFRTPDGLEIQRLPGRTAWRLEGGVLRGERELAVRYVARGAATGRIPDLVLGWWDARADRWHELRLPGRPYRIEPQERSRNVDRPPSRSLAEREAKTGAGPPHRLVGAVLVVALAVLAAFFGRRRGVSADARLLAACLARRPRAAARLLLAHRPAGGWPPSQSLAAWERLERALYAGRGAPPCGLGAWWRLRPLLVKARPRPRPEPLPTLWPDPASRRSDRLPPGNSSRNGGAADW